MAKVHSGKRVRRPAVETKKLLIEAACHVLVANNGELEIGDVARRAGVSSALAHYHFGNKAGLLTAVVAAFYSRLDDAIVARPYEGVSWIDREVCRIHDLVSFFYEDPVAVLVINTLQRDPSLGFEGVERARRMNRLGALNIAQAQRDGDIDPAFDPALLVSMILGGVMAGLNEALATNPRPEAAGVAAQICGFVARAAGVPLPTMTSVDEGRAAS